MGHELVYVYVYIYICMGHEPWKEPSKKSAQGTMSLVIAAAVRAEGKARSFRSGGPYTAYI